MVETLFSNGALAVASALLSLLLGLSSAARARARSRERYDRLIQLVEVSLFDRSDANDVAPATLDQKLAQIHALSRELERLNREVKASFDFQVAATEAARQDAEAAKAEARDARALAEISAEAREALRIVLRDEVRRELREDRSEAQPADRRFQVLVGLALLFAGAALGYLTPGVVRWLEALLS